MVTSRQFNVHYASVFIKQIVQLSFANVEWEVPDEDCVVVVASSSRHDDNANAAFLTMLMKL